MQTVHTPKQSRKWTACRTCKRSRAECGGLSLRGFCTDCGVQQAIDNMRDLMYHRGQGWERYRRGMQRYVAHLTEG